MNVNVEDLDKALNHVIDMVIDSGGGKEFHGAVMKLAELASRLAAASYKDERVHLRMSVRAEFCYELADSIFRAQEASETEAKVEEAERIREELSNL